MEDLSAREVLVLDGVSQYFWAPLNEGILYLNTKAIPQPLILFFDFGLRRAEPVATIPKEHRFGVGPAFAASQDGRRILYATLDRIESDIVVVENLK